jgi:catechol 2,3-dioxygenase-like lactoylglutathione lyase family enzyme
MNYSVIDIDHIQIAAPQGCEWQARKFFGGLLGLEELAKPESLASRGGCWFRVGSRQLHIGVEENFQPARKAHPAFSVSNLDALFESLKAAGANPVWDEALDGVRRFFAQDPWGNRLEFAEPAIRDR